jgi:hypothetical protein
MQLNKIYKKNCIGKVPSSIADLDECSLCQNEELCASLWGGPQVARHHSTDEQALGRKADTTTDRY